MIGSPHFQQCLQYYSRKTSKDHMLSEVKTKSVLLASQYIMILPFDVISSVMQTCTKSFLFYFILFIIIQILTLVCKINGIAPNSPRAHKNFLSLGCRLWLSLVFSIIYRVVLIYVYFWSNLLFFDFNVTATHLHLFKKL